MIDRHHTEERNGVLREWIQASLVQKESRSLRPFSYYLIKIFKIWKLSFFSNLLKYVGDNVEDIDAFSQTDEAQDELVSLVNILHVLPQAAGHVEEPDQGGEGVVHETGEHGHIDHSRHHKTFLKSMFVQNKEMFISNSLPFPCQ